MRGFVSEAKVHEQNGGREDDAQNDLETEEDSQFCGSTSSVFDVHQSNTYSPELNSKHK